MIEQNVKYQNHLTHTFMEIEREREMKIEKKRERFDLNIFKEVFLYNF